jgi:hypothetical protein
MRLHPSTLLRRVHSFGIAEVWVVEDVEELGSKTKPHAVLLGN